MTIRHKKDEETGGRCHALTDRVDL